MTTAPREAEWVLLDRGTSGASTPGLKVSATALSAAQSLEERAHNLQTWPIDEGTLRFVAIVITGVLTGLIVRGSFAALGY